MSDKMLVKDIVAGKKFLNKAGEEKTQWVNVGIIMINRQDGKMTVKFNAWVNPMAFANDKGEVWFNVFDKKDKESKEGKTAADDEPGPDAPQPGTAKTAKAAEMDDTITAISEGDEQWLKENAEPDVELPF
ncbi:hypothetical protein [Candidatus Avelusimicrobium fimicolum]|uniref:hypothetical protein n=1 Tax=Candidatus Avelusimicrobium fimicolum TaxID=3416216 RepID=UPI003D1274B3